MIIRRDRQVERAEAAVLSVSQVSISPSSYIKTWRHHGSIYNRTATEPYLLHGLARLTEKRNRTKTRRRLRTNPLTRIENDRMRRSRIVYSIGMVIPSVLVTHGYVGPYHMSRNHCHGLSSCSPKISSFVTSRKRRYHSMATTTTTTSRPFSQHTKCCSASASTSTTTTMDCIPTIDDDDWRIHPSINPTLKFCTLRVPISQIGYWLKHPEIQPYLARPSTTTAATTAATAVETTTAPPPSPLSSILGNIHPRLKLVQDDDDDEDEVENLRQSNNKPTHKLLLLRIDGDSANNNIIMNEDLVDVMNIVEKDQKKRNGIAASSTNDVSLGPIKSIPITYKKLSYGYILRQLLLHYHQQENEHQPTTNTNAIVPPLPTSYEQVGHVAHFNLKPEHLKYKKLIGQVLLESATGRGGGGGSDKNDADDDDDDSGSGGRITTVVNKVGQVKGKFRTFDYEVLATTSKNPDDPSLLETTLVEDGVKVHLNLAECYWCTRLSGERQELINDILRTTGTTSSSSIETSDAPPTPLMLPTHDLVVADVFCGVGAVCLLLAKEYEQRSKILASQDNFRCHRSPTLTVIANDWNSKAVEYLRRSINTNKFRIVETDSHVPVTDEVPNNGQEPSTMFQLHSKESYEFLITLGTDESHGDGSTMKKNKIPHHILMNFPLEAPNFLGALRWWSSKRIQEQYRDDGVYPRFHVYTFARASSSSRRSIASELKDDDLDSSDDDTKEQITARVSDEEEVAVNLVADAMIPAMDLDYFELEQNDDASSDNNDEKVEYRRSELDNEFSANVSTRVVRDVAPGKVVVCVGFSLTPKLVRYMQGDYD